LGHGAWDIHAVFLICPMIHALRYFISLLFLVFIAACSKVEILDPEPEPAPAPIIALCTYYDSAKVVGILGMNGRVQGRRFRGVNDDRVLLEFDKTLAHINIRYDKTESFEKISSRVVKFDSSTYNPVRMEITQDGSFPFTYEAISGELYIRRDSVGKGLRFDWCDVIFSSATSTYRSWGGYHLQIP